MTALKTIILLSLSNVFMTFAWYAHLKDLKDKTWFIAALISWGIAFFEYMLQVPANRIGSTAFTLPQLKIMQEVITLSVFLPFAVFFMKEKVSWNYAGAAVCLAGAVFFIFRK
ncbi:MAG: DMT family protein [Luteolibacter sp.]